MLTTLRLYQKPTLYVCMRRGGWIWVVELVASLLSEIHISRDSDKTYSEIELKKKLKKRDKTHYKPTPWFEMKFSVSCNKRN